MLVISPQQPCGIGRYSLVSGNSPMRASDPTNHLQCLPQSIKVSPRRDEGIPPYRLLALPAAYYKKLCRERLIPVQEPNQVLKAEEIIRTKALIRADLTLLNRSLHKAVNQTLVMILIWAIFRTLMVRKTICHSNIRVIKIDRRKITWLKEMTDHREQEDLRKRFVCSA